MKRRDVLRGMGVSLCLPLFEAWTPTVAHGAQSGLATTASGAPLRMAFVYFPNGAQQQNWFPEDAVDDASSGDKSDHPTSSERLNCPTRLGSSSMERSTS